MTHNRRKVLYALVVVFVLGALVLGFYLFHRFDEGVTRHRQANAAQQVSQHQADVHLCEVAINQSGARLLAVIARLTEQSPPPADEAEAAQRAAGQRILNEGFGPIDCERFVATGEIVPKEQP